MAGHLDAHIALQRETEAQGSELMCRVTQLVSGRALSPTLSFLCDCFLFSLTLKS